jgi:hypothetical protein
VCVYVCVCVCERERERERDLETLKLADLGPVSAVAPHAVLRKICVSQYVTSSRAVNSLCKGLDERSGSIFIVKCRWEYSTLKMEALRSSEMFTVTIYQSPWVTSQKTSILIPQLPIHILYFCL